MDAVCFREWARLKEGKQDHLLENAMIAVTARIHELIVATRNDADFAELDVPVVNPFRGDG
jgi:predicted nucleic acid-binding protein